MAGGINPFGFGVGAAPVVPRRLPQDIPAAPFGFAAPSKWDQTKQILWDSNLASPFRGIWGLMNADPYTLYTDTGAAGQQAAADSFDAASAATVGSGMIPGEPNSLRMGIKAYHGSPHSFDKFSMDKIGTGEGAQAYGHGLYFAENEGVARGYKDMLSKGANVTDQQHMTAQRFINMAGGDREEAISMLHSLNDEGDPDVQKIADYIRNPPGSMYEVSINADPNAFLDWDKPLSEQPEVQKRLATIGEAARSSTTKGVDKYISLENMLGAIDWPDNATPDVRAQYRKGAAARVSEKLKEAGIPGIKYLDAGSRGKGVAYVQPMYKGQPYGDPVPAHAHNQIEQLTKRYKDMGYDVEVQDLGTRNYVVFDDKLISIVRKYGIAGASAMLGYNLLDGMNPAQADELKRIEAGK